MKKFILILLLIVNGFYIGNFLIDFGIRFSSTLNVFFGIVFVISIILSGMFLFRSKRESGNHPYLSLVVLSISFASLGWFTFFNYLSLIMG